jgi:hypothetical protein
MSVGWTSLSLGELIRESKRLIKGYWIGRLESEEKVLAKCTQIGIRARQFRIGGKEIWQQEIQDDCNVVRYHDRMGKEVNYDDQNAVHIKAQDLGAKYGNDPEYQSKTGAILISAFDTFKRKRVIVDGVHRAAVMSSIFSKNSDYTDRILYEWYGHVRAIFPYDFMQFYK